MEERGISVPFTENFIAKLQVGEQIIVDQEGKQEAMLQFYEDLLATTENREHTINLEAIGLQQHDLSVLDEPFSEEVWNTVKNMPQDQAPGPDGFTGRFYKTCWHIIKDHIMLALAAIQQGQVARFRLLNTAYITLLPKKPDALLVKYFRPISLIHSLAKLMTKIMANRLAPLLPNLIPSNQSAFVRGRSIHDNFLFGQQMVKALHSCTARRRPTFSLNWTSRKLLTRYLVLS